MRIPPAGLNRPPHKASGHLESKTGQVWWVLGRILRERVSPKNQTFLHPPCHRAAEGPKVLEKEEPGSVTLNILSQPPSILSGSSRVRSIKVTLGPLEKMEHFPVRLGQPNSPL